MTLTIVEIAGISIIPAACASALAGLPVYAARGWRSISRSAWLDTLVWAFFLLVYFLFSIGIMNLNERYEFVPSPTPPTDPNAIVSADDGQKSDALKLTISAWSLIPAGLSALAAASLFFALGTRAGNNTGLYVSSLMNYLALFFGISTSIMLIDFEAK